MRYLLDTNIVSYLLDQGSPFFRATWDRFGGCGPKDDFCLSVLTMYEIQGLFAAAPHFIPVFEARLRPLVTVYPLPEQGASLYQSARRSLADRSDAKHQVDFMLAASSILYDATLVSHDALFPKLHAVWPHFRLEDWAVA